MTTRLSLGSFFVRRFQINYNSTYFSSGAYDSVADYVFAEKINALLLEYDDSVREAGHFAKVS